MRQFLGDQSHSSVHEDGMAETFYSVLGLEDDADAETVRRAYRELVKKHHPDVSDDPAAPERFKRLTTARDVLLDDDERSRYDRLGHDDYVRQHVESGAWTAGSATEQREQHSQERTRASTNSRRDQAERDPDRTAWLGEDGPGSSGHWQRTRRRRARATGGTGRAEDWQYASKTYRRAETDVGAGQTSLAHSVASGLVSVGPWLLVHLVFIASAAATAWIVAAQVQTHADPSWPPLLGGVLLIALVVFASALHVISQLYS